MPEPLQVEGGAGGTAVDLLALNAAGSRLTQHGADLSDGGVRVAAVAGDPVLAVGAVVDPSGYAQVQQLLAPLAVHLPLEGARVGTLGVGVRAAAVAYAATEAATERLVVTTRDVLAARLGKLGLRLAATPYGWFALAVPTIGWMTARTAPLVLQESERLADDVASGQFRPDSLDDRGLRLALLQQVALRSDLRAAGDAAVSWVAAHPEAGQHLVGAVPAALRVSGGVEGLASVLGLLGLVALPGVADRSASVRRAGAPTVTSAPVGVLDLLGRAVPFAPPTEPTEPTEPTASVTPSAYAPGHVRVDRLDGPRGTSWVVTIPPTQTWSLAGHRSPFDAASNVHLMAGSPAASSRATTEAMASAGVRSGQPVMLVGYSQGGLTAVQVAADPAVRERFEVTSVLTAGAPTGGFEAPDGVHVLSLEHRQDLVVAADGVDNPDDPTWTTVRRDLLVGTGEDARVAAELPDRPWAAHHLTPYLGTAALVDGSSDESVRAWMRSAAPFWDAPGTSATTTQYVARRD